MNVRHVCTSCMLTMFVLMNFEIYTVNASVSMYFEPHIIRLDNHINITCAVNGNDVFNSTVTRQWSKGTHLICFNGRPIDSNKYTEILNSRNQFKLQIRNVSMSDLNCKYQCRYGFDTVTTPLQLSKDNFEYPPADHVRAVVHRNNSEQTFSINLNFKKIFPVPKCTARFGGSSLSFNITSNTTHGIFYEMNLRLISTDKLQCDEDISVECELIALYHIPTEGIQKCKIDVSGNSIKITRIILLIITSCMSLVILIIACSTICCRKMKQGNGRNMSICHNLGRPCMDESKPLIRMLFTKCSLHSDERLYKTGMCLNSRKDTLDEKDTKDDKDNIHSSLLTENTLYERDPKDDEDNIISILLTENPLCEKDPKDDENNKSSNLLTEIVDTLDEKDQKDDKENINSSPLTEKKEKVSRNDQLHRGNAISFRRSIGPLEYEHHGIVEKVIPETSRFRIIHVTGTSKDLVASISSNLTTGICSEVIDFETDTDIYKYTFTCGRQDGRNPAAVAEMFLDYGFPEELGFHILHFNCESFSRYCATGVVYSKQTRRRNEAAQIKLDVLVRKNFKNHVSRLSD